MSFSPNDMRTSDFQRKFRDLEMNFTNTLSPKDREKGEKCISAKKFLQPQWHIEIDETPFLDLLDSEKIAFDISLQELNQILKNGPFTLEEKNHIKRIRHQGRNNKAAQRLRSKNRQQNEVMKRSINVLKQEKDFLIQEKEYLMEQLDNYQQYFSQQNQFN
ncbi:hypothetical protein LOD99_8854 [Oopsacas minuta]|uniref:Basic leucine zipper domain-containing protein n=1 Tax=Oopsacas minuta TaxID=111878 RepID=A0AAV7JEB8_9METZ|nr:hypothetical protein LOD99_8854 [Oopsacas minuta]